MKKRVSVFVVDDNPSFLASVRELIGQLPDVNRVECATSAEDALARIGKSCPDLVLTDLSMPKQDGFDLVRGLPCCCPVRPRVVVMTVHGTPQHRAAALRMGAEDCISKHELAIVIPELIASLAGAAAPAP